MAKHLFNDEGDPRKYYAAIPNIIWTLGLSTYEISLYAYFKKVAGENGKCWKSTATIAKEMSIGSGTVSRTKASLALPRRELGGKALISITSEMHNGGNENHAVTVTDIWPENMALLSHLQERKATRSGLEGARSTGERRVPQGKATPSTGANKEEPLKNNPEEERRGYPFDHFAVIEYTERISPEPELAIRQAEVIAESVVDSELSRAVWADVLCVFKGNGYHQRHAGNAVDRYKKDMARIAAGKKESPIPQATSKVETLKEQIEREARA